MHVLENKNPGRLAGVFLRGRYRYRYRRYKQPRNENVSAWRLQLSIFAEHSAALVTDAPTMSGKRRSAAQQVGPAHPGGTVAHPRRGRLAWGELGHIDRIGGARKRKQWPDQ
jgi:hypothetical protein